MIPDSLHKMFFLLPLRERRGIIALFVCILLTALLEIAGVASIMPFMAVVANPALIDNQELLLAIGRAAGLNDNASYVVFLGSVALSLLVAGNLFAACTTAFTVRTGARLNRSISRRLLAAYLNRPYEHFLRDNSSRLNRNILNEVYNAVSFAILPALNVAARTVSAGSLIALMLLVEPLLSLLAVLILGGFYAVVYLLVRKTLKWNGERNHKAHQELSRIVAEAFGGVKEIKIAGREAEYLSRFSEPSRRVAKGQTIGGVVPQIPRYLMEVVAFGGVILLVIFFLSTGKELATVLPLITLYAVAGYRLMPALQQIFSGVTQVRFYLPSLDLLCHDLSGAPSGKDPVPDNSTVQPLPFDREIRLEGVTYRYSGSISPALAQVSLTIAANSTVAFAGESGSGKSTLVDLLLGLLSMQDGELFVDGMQVSGADIAAWQRNIGYVPQAIFLSDDTISGNIAFGVPADQIDHAAVQGAARLANLDGFIEHELPCGYDTVIGERGVRLSGGQRQRIGIARALYHDPKVLVLDEATSALDGITENAVLDAIHNLSHRKTIIIVAHRFTTIRDCDCIYLLDKGMVVAQGTYDELMGASSRFSAMSGRQ